MSSAEWYSSSQSLYSTDNLSVNMLFLTLDGSPLMNLFFTEYSSGATSMSSINCCRVSFHPWTVLSPSSHQAALNMLRASCSTELCMNQAYRSMIISMKSAFIIPGWLIFCWNQVFAFPSRSKSRISTLCSSWSGPPSCNVLYANTTLHNHSHSTSQDAVPSYFFIVLVSRCVPLAPSGIANLCSKCSCINSMICWNFHSICCAFTSSDLAVGARDGILDWKRGVKGLWTSFWDPLSLLLLDPPSPGSPLSWPCWLRPGSLSWCDLSCPLSPSPGPCCSLSVLESWPLLLGGNTQGLLSSSNTIPWSATVGFIPSLIWLNRILCRVTQFFSSLDRDFICPLALCFASIGSFLDVSTLCIDEEGVVGFVVEHSIRVVTMTSRALLGSRPYTYYSHAFVPGGQHTVLQRIDQLSISLPLPVPVPLIGACLYP